MLTYPTDWCGEFSARPTKKSEAEAEEGRLAKELIAAYCDIFKAIYKRSPQILGADSKAARLLVKQHGLDRARWIVEQFLEEPPRWHADNMMFDLRYIPNVSNKILARGG